MGLYKKDESLGILCKVALTRMAFIKISENSNIVISVMFFCKESWINKIIFRNLT